MSEPRRLLDGAGPASLLTSSLQGDRLDDDAKRRMRAALGLGALPIVASASGMAQAAKTVAAKGGALAAGANVPSTVGVGAGIVKWGTVVLVGALVVAGIGLAAERANTDPPVAAIVRASRSPSPRAPDPIASVAASGSLPVDSRAVEALPSAPAAPAAPSAPSAPAAASARTVRAAAALARPLASSTVAAASSAPADLGEELRLLEDARANLRGGDPSTALASIARYRRAVPSGALQLEASVIEIEALVALGRREEAVIKGRAILARQPEGPLSERVHRTIGE